ncbi:MAG TPA: thymidine phosphorylase, partial [Spirochaetia bacterium]|nr:thymidine phosphorylase [Spirochaetia bacterium]
SKKFAEGADALVFDVKCGDGAFMKHRDEARTLAKSLVDTGVSLGKRIVAVITNMDEPLGRMVGNFVEAEESALCLQGKGPEDLMEVTLRLSGWMLVAGDKAENIDAAVEMCRKKLADGEPWKRFLANIRAQHGDPDRFQKGMGLVRAKVEGSIRAPAKGFVAGIRAYPVGMAGVYLGAGRSKADDKVYPNVGIELLKKRGEAVERGEAVCTLFAESEESLETATRLVEEAYSYGVAAPDAAPMILEEMAAL